MVFVCVCVSVCDILKDFKCSKIILYLNTSQSAHWHHKRSALSALSCVLFVCSFCQLVSCFTLVIFSLLRYLSFLVFITGTMYTLNSKN